MINNTLLEVYLKKPRPQPYCACDKFTVYGMRTDANDNLQFLVYLKKSGWNWEFAENFIPIGEI